MCGKRAFARLIRRLRRFLPGLDLAPDSWVIPDNLREFKRVREKDPERVFVLKPDTGSGGQGIELVRGGDEIGDAPHGWVLQAYVYSHLIDGRKFDLRVYVLVSSTDPLEIWVHREGVARFATEDADSDSKFAWLTNTTVNKKNPKADRSAMTRPLASVLARLEQDGFDPLSLWERVQELVTMAVLAGSGDMTAADIPTIFSRGRGFHLIGADVILERGSLQPLVLELNSRPSMEATNDEIRELKERVIGDVLEICAPPARLQKAIDRLSARPWRSYGFVEKNLCQTVRNVSTLRISRRNGFHRVYPPDSRDSVLTIVASISVRTAIPRRFDFLHDAVREGEPLGPDRGIWKARSEIVWTD
jgi:hypothetical protein